MTSEIEVEAPSISNGFEKKRKLDNFEHSSSKKTKGSSNKLSIDPKTGLSQCFSLVHTTLYLPLAPCYILKPNFGIQTQHLDPLLLSWYGPLGGVILAYQNLKLLGQSEEEQEVANEDSEAFGKIIHESPYSYFWISVDFLIWKPQPGQVIKGDVNFQASSHISLLVHGVFLANIRREDIPESWQFVFFEADENAENSEDVQGGEEGEQGSSQAADAVNKIADDIQEEEMKKNGEYTKAKEMQNAVKSLGYWVDENGQKVNDTLRFNVKRIFSSGKVVSLQGTLLGENMTGQARKPRNFEYNSNGGSYGNNDNANNTAATEVVKPKHKKFFDDVEDKTDLFTAESTATALPVEKEMAKNSNNQEDDDEESSKSSQVGSDSELDFDEKNKEKADAKNDGTLLPVTNGDEVPQYQEDSDSDDSDSD